MGIYIKEKDGVSRSGQGMPENCMYDCKLVNACLFVPRWGDKDTLDELRITRAKNCPLVEVPTPHGDLIDRKAYWDETNKYEWKSIEDVLSCAFTLVAQAPTIIEAEE